MLVGGGCVQTPTLTVAFRLLAVVDDVENTQRYVARLHERDFIVNYERCEARVLGC